MEGKIISSAVIYILLLNEAGAATNRKFPANFKFGTATAAYQIEGGWDADGKGENIWDHMCHTNPAFIKDGATGDVTCDSYHKYADDVELLKDLGVDFYRFSLSWSRILPEGVAGSPVNPKGIQYYRNLIEALLEAGIEPMVTMFHWDTPQVLEELGGWPNPKMAEHFAYYAKTLYENFGDLVGTWMTFNEPLQICSLGYGLGYMAPGRKEGGVEDYKCAHTLIKGHAKAYRVYEEKFRQKQGGRVGIVADTTWFEPATVSEENKIAAERSLQFTYGWFLNPIVHGNYPQVMMDRIAARSKQQGYKESRLPKFSQDEIDYIKGTYDFLAINSYTSAYAQNRPNDTDEVSLEADIGVEVIRDETWKSGASWWLNVVPWGMRKLLNWLKDTYDNPVILITESGFSDKGGLQDDDRIYYYKEYLSNVLEALLDDRVNVSHYTAWSLMDNFEWAQGYTEKFGMYHVDFEDPKRPRTPKASAGYYKKVIATRCLVDNCE